jgi:hypothetical protein
MAEKSTGRVRAHTRYRNTKGDIVPGVTTITGVLNKPALVKWANNLGLQGIDSSKYTDEKATIGTLAHYLIECHIKNETPVLDDYTKNQIDQAENSVLKFFEWERTNKLEVIGSELELVSNKHNFGGCCDIYATLNGAKTLIDLKTAKGIFPEMITQVAAYSMLLEENGHPVEDIRILRIGRDETEGFEDHKASQIELHKEKFLHCLAIYTLDKKLRGK